MITTITIPGKPRPLKRARRSANGGMYDPPENVAEKQRIAYAVKAAAIDLTLADGPVKLTVFARFARPKAHRKANGTLRDSAPVYHTQKPDGSNILKLVEDALTGIAWRDDAQIWDATITKDWDSSDSLVIYIET